MPGEIDEQKQRFVVDGGESATFTLFRNEKVGLRSAICCRYRCSFMFTARIRSTEGPVAHTSPVPTRRHFAIEFCYSLVLLEELPECRVSHPARKSKLRLFQAIPSGMVLAIQIKLSMPELAPQCGQFNATGSLLRKFNMERALQHSQDWPNVGAKPNSALQGKELCEAPKF